MTKKRGLAPRTLAEAHELLGHMRPGLSAAPATWLRYYRRSAAVYTEVAEVDRGHHHEALYWANRERAKANHLQAEIAKNASSPTVKTVKDEDEKSEPIATVHTEQ